MNSSLITRVLGCLMVGILLHAATAAADPTEPVPNPYWRDLRPGYVRTWYVFSDVNTVHGQVNGILDPGDTMIGSFHNWWTPVSASTQHNYDDGPYGPYGFFYRSTNPTDDMASGPMNFASSTTPGAENYWLPREKNTMEFYLTYSQFDNNDWSTFTDGQSGTTAEILQQRNLNRNGWALGWLTNDVTQKDGVYSNDQTVAGKVKMDVFVHNGELAGTYVDGNSVVQTTRSNPQVSLSNDIDNNAQDFVGAGGQWHPPDYDTTETGGVDNGYTWDENQTRFEANSLTESDFDGTVASMEVFETDPYALAAADVVVGGKRPSVILSTLTDGNGLPYAYDDAYLSRNPADPSEGAPYVKDATDGAVLAGLSGYAYYDPNDPLKVNDWGEQQVIRIDLDPSLFEAFDAEGNPTAGGITKIVIWDFGFLPGSSQVNPTAIVLDLADLAKFPDHRFYIATVTPEPTSLVLLAMGGLAVLTRNRKRAVR